MSQVAQWKDPPIDAEPQSIKFKRYSFYRCITEWQEVPEWYFNWLEPPALERIVGGLLLGLDYHSLLQYIE
jgi:hypothetical protein